MHGFYIEVTNAHAEKMPADYRRRQTLKNAERYITPELKAFEDKALSARDRALALEKSLYDELLEALPAHLPALQRIARALAQLDVLAAFASTAVAAQLLPARSSSTRPLIEIEARPPPGGRERRSSALHRQRLPALARRASCCSSPARTWAASRPTCARWR